MTFDATKTKLLSFNRHRGPLLVTVEINGIELPEETGFRFLGLIFTPRSHRLDLLDRVQKSQLSMVWTFC